MTIDVLVRESNTALPVYTPSPAANDWLDTRAHCLGASQLRPPSELRRRIRSRPETSPPLLLRPMAKPRSHGRPTSWSSTVPGVAE